MTRIKHAKTVAKSDIENTIALSAKTTPPASSAVFVATPDTWLAIVPIDRGGQAGEMTALAPAVRSAVAMLLIVKWR